MGFTLLEMLLALALGLVFSGVLVQVLLVQGRQGALLVRLLRERSFQRRTIELVRADLQRADWLQLGQASGAACSLVGRDPVLQISTTMGPITYTVGPPPSPIWRGKVLMRCGPAFGLDGEPSEGEAQNRVVIDSLPAGGFRAESSGFGRLRLGLLQQFTLPDGTTQRIETAVELAGLVTPR
jgi:type II secretory pathway pseudopilin PulG